MSVEQFSKSDFAAALPRRKDTGDVLYLPPTLEYGQWVWVLPVTAYVGLRV